MKKMIAALLVTLVTLVAASTATAHSGAPLVTPKLAQKYVMAKYDIIAVRCAGIGQRYAGGWFKHVACASFDADATYCFIFHPRTKTTFTVRYVSCP